MLGLGELRVSPVRGIISEERMRHWPQIQVGTNFRAQRDPRWHYSPLGITAVPWPPRVNQTSCTSSSVGFVQYAGKLAKDVLGVKSEEERKSDDSQFEAGRIAVL